MAIRLERETGVEPATFPLGKVRTHRAHIQGAPARSAGPSRRKESPSEGEEEPFAAGAERPRVVRRAVEPASGRAARRCARRAQTTRDRGATCWSGKRGSNPRLPPWQGGALPLSYSRSDREG